MLFAVVRWLYKHALVILSGAFSRSSFRAPAEESCVRKQSRRIRAEMVYKSLIRRRSATPSPIIQRIPPYLSSPGKALRLRCDVVQTDSRGRLSLQVGVYRCNITMATDMFPRTNLHLFFKNYRLWARVYDILTIYKYMYSEKVCLWILSQTKNMTQSS